MIMFWTMLRKEIVGHVLTLRFGVTFILFLLLVFASMFVTVRTYLRDRDYTSANFRTAEGRMDEILKDEDPDNRRRRLFYWEGRWDVVDLPPLSSLAQGLRDVTPAMVNTRYGDMQMIGRQEEGNPLMGLLPAPDLVYMVGVVLSLLAILFAFDSVCGEKETGTLRLMLSNAVPRDTILLSKWLGGLIVLLVPFAIAVLGGLGYAWYRGALQITGDTPQRLAALLGLACLYISVFFTLSLAISCMTHKSATALFICLLVWVGWILVVPNLAPVTAKILSPTPAPEKINAEIAAIEEETRLRQERLALTSGEVSYGSTMEKKREQIDSEGKRRREQVERFFRVQVDRQSDLAKTLGRLSPSGCWTYAAVTLAGTGPRAYKRLEDATDKLKQQMDEFAQKINEARWRTGQTPEITKETIPTLRLDATTLQADMSAAMFDAAILAILNVLFFMAAFVLFLRYDAR